MRRGFVARAQQHAHVQRCRTGRSWATWDPPHSSLVSSSTASARTKSHARTAFAASAASLATVLPPVGEDLRRLSRRIPLE